MRAVKSNGMKIAAEVDHLLTKLNCTLLLSAGGLLHFISGGEQGKGRYVCGVPGLGGIAAGEGLLAAACKKHLVCMGPVYPGSQGDPRLDTELAPLNLWSLGNWKPGEMAFGKDGLWAVDPRAGLLGVISGPYPPVASWRAPIIASGGLRNRGLVLSGLAMDAGSPAFVTAESRGFMASKSGVVIHAPTKEIVADGLPSPSSPRLSDGSLLMLSAKTRECTALDPDDGKWETLAALPGLPAGMALYGDYLFIGVAPARSLRPKGVDPAPFSGVVVFNRFTGNEVGRIEFESGRMRLDGIQTMPGLVRPLSEQAIRRSLARLGMCPSDSGRTAFGKIARGLLALVMSGSFLLPFFPSKGTAAPNPSEKLFEFKFGIHNPFSNGNPLYDANQHFNPAVAVVDIDGDGDMDAFLGTYYGEFLFFENIGTAQKPDFAPVEINPFGIQPYDGAEAYSTFTTPHFADIDGDGDFDLFFGSKYGYIYFAENVGTAKQPQFASPVPYPFGIAPGYAYDGSYDVFFYYSAPALADIDGDGDFDLFFGAGSDYYYYNYYGYVLFQENTGTKYSPQFGKVRFFPFNLSGDYLMRPNPEFVDVDGDKDLDVFVGDQYGSVFFQENTGDVNSPDFGAQQYGPWGLSAEFYNYTYWGNLAPAAVDIDGDGDMDLFIGEKYSDLQFFENTGSNTSPSFLSKGAHTGYISSPRLGDIDGDGDLDAFSGNWYGEFPFFQNTGSNTDPNFASPVWEPFGLSYLYYTWSLPALTDIDGDKDLDLFSGTYYGDTYFFENIGTSQFPKFNDYQAGPFGLPAAPDGISAPNFGDIDGDGDFDAMIGERFGNFLFSRNSNSPTAPSFDPLQTNPFGLTRIGYDSAPALVDLDGDGDPDLFSGDYYGNILFFENAGDKQNPAFGSFSKNPFGLEKRFTHYWNYYFSYYSIPELGDIDGDGDLDVFVGDYSGRIHFFERISRADVSVSKAADSDPVFAGESLTYTVRVDNNGPDIAWGVAVSDVLPDDTTVADISGCENNPAGIDEPCSLGMIPAGRFKEFTITVGVDPSASGTLTNEAEVSTISEDAVDANNHASLDTSVETSADLSVSKSTDTDPVVAGNSMVYTIRVNNNGPSDAKSVQVTDILPEGVGATEISGCQSNRAGEAVPCFMGDIPAGEFKEFTIAVDIGPASSGILANQVEVHAATDDPDLDNNTVALNTPAQSVADLSVSKSSDTDAVVAGESTINYTIRVDNSGPSDAESVQVADHLPPDTTVTQISGCRNTPTDGAVPCSLGDIPVGESKQYIIAVKVEPSASGILTNKVEVASASIDPNPADNTDSIDATVSTRADLILTVDAQTVQRAPAALEPDIHVNPGDELQYKVTVRNNGPSDAENVVVDSSFSTLQGVSVDNSQGCSEDPAGYPECSIGDIAAGTEQSFTIDVTLGDDFMGSLVFQASGRSDTVDIDIGDNSDIYTALGPIPTLSQWGASLLAGLLGIVAIFTRRRSQKER